MRWAIESCYGSLLPVGHARPGRRAFGVPPGGAFDPHMMALANALVGNPPECLVLELALADLTVRTEVGGWFAWVGAGASDRCEHLATGETLRFAAPKEGCRSYLAASGGLFRREDGFLVADDQPLSAIRLSDAGFVKAGPIRVLPGPQHHLLDFEAFLDATYQVSMQSDRRGVRLVGSALCHDVHLPSEPSCLGAIQIPPGGQPIILGPDGPTIGGYPKVAVVIQADLHRIAQLRPGQTVRFEVVSEAFARQAAQARKEGIRNQLNQIRLATSF